MRLDDLRLGARSALALALAVSAQVLAATPATSVAASSVRAATTARTAVRAATLQTLTVSPSPALVGVPVSVSGTATGPCTLKIDWGDGTLDTLGPAGNGISHAYAVPRSFPGYTVIGRALAPCQGTAQAHVQVVAGQRARDANQGAGVSGAPGSASRAAAKALTNPTATPTKQPGPGGPLPFPNDGKILAPPALAPGLIDAGHTVTRTPVSAKSVAPFDTCKMRICHPVITAVDRQNFGPDIEGGKLVLTGQDFGNVPGKVILAGGSSPQLLVVRKWDDHQVVASAAKVGGVLDGLASVAVRVSTGAESLSIGLQFQAARENAYLTMSRVDVLSCSDNTSVNQCNQVPSGGDGKAYFKWSLKSSPAICGNHDDHCQGPFCLGWPEGTDRYGVRVAPQSRIVSVDLRSQWCKRTLGKTPATCNVSIQQSPASAPYEMVVVVHWKNEPQTESTYNIDVLVSEPRRAPLS
jgi:hypothetical protein